MIEYQANFVDRYGNVVRSEKLNSKDDSTAMAAAEKLVNVSHDVVVWAQNRLLVKLSHGCRS